MRISQFGAPNVFLSSNVALAGTAEEAGCVAVNVPLKIEDKGDEEGPLVAILEHSGLTALEGRAVEKRTSVVWLLFEIPRESCAEGTSLTFCALADEVVLWQGKYRVLWRGRFPGLEPTA
jgi:hypothetical protein